jgi:hypothetical protein
MTITVLDNMEYGNDAAAQAAYVTSALAYIPGANDETVEFYNRVTADGGTIISLDDIDDAISDAKTNGYYSNLKAWYSAQFACKKTGNAITKLYDISGNDYDITAVSGSPTWTDESQNGRAAIIFNGSSDYMATPNMSLSQPTHLIAIFNQITYTENDYLFDGLSFPTCIFGQDATGGVNNLYMYAGSHGCDSKDIGLNAYGIASLLFYGANSTLQINNSTVRTGSIGAASAGGITIGAGAGNAYSRAANMGLCDLIIFATDQTSKYPDIRSFLNSKYSCY